MKIALVHDWLNGMRGGEKVLEVLCDLFPHAPIYTLLLEDELVSPSIRGRREIHTSWIQRSAFLRKNYRYLLPFLPAAIERFRLDSYDLILSSSHCVAKGVRVGGTSRHICYCHTPMRYLWDFQEEYFGPQSFGKRLLLKPLLDGLRNWDVRTSKRVDHFIANSRFVAERIRRVYGRESDVIPPPVDTSFFTPSRHSGDYFLMVSALVPYKKVDMAVEAFRRTKETLVVIGAGPLQSALRKSAPSNVHFLGWVNRDSLLQYYQECRALIFPQIEDFGIVPLEAQSCGRPLIALGQGGALETVVGHPAGYLPSRERLLTGAATGIFFREQNVEGLLEGINTFRKLEKTFQPGAIRQHARTYDRESFRRKLADYILSKVPEVREEILQTYGKASVR